jgi:1,4-dihydroxy-2-naphthoate octaprenyltransferase
MIVSVSSLLVRTTYAVYLAHAFHPGLFVLMLLATLCVDMGMTAFNSNFDFWNGVDTVDADVERWKTLVQHGI